MSKEIRLSARSMAQAYFHCHLLVPIEVHAEVVVLYVEGRYMPAPVSMLSLKKTLGA